MWRTGPLNHPQVDIQTNTPRWCGFESGYSHMFTSPSQPVWTGRCARAPPVSCFKPRVKMHKSNRGLESKIEQRVQHEWHAPMTSVQLANVFADCLVCDVTGQKKKKKCPVLTSWKAAVGHLPYRTGHSLLNKSIPLSPFYTGTRTVVQLKWPRHAITAAWVNCACKRTD